MGRGSRNDHLVVNFIPIDVFELEILRIVRCVVLVRSTEREIFQDHGSGRGGSNSSGCSNGGSSGGSTSEDGSDSCSSSSSGGGSGGNCSRINSSSVGIIDFVCANGCACGCDGSSRVRTRTRARDIEGRGTAVSPS